LAIETPAN